jgi:hypothetical protein
MFKIHNYLITLCFNLRIEGRFKAVEWDSIKKLLLLVNRKSLNKALIDVYFFF